MTDAVRNAAQPLWAIEHMLSSMKGLMTAAKAQANTTEAQDTTLDGLVTNLEDAVEAFHDGAAQILTDNSEPVPASGGGNKT